MYDALLDELEDDSTPNQEEVSELAEKPAGDLDVDDEIDSVDLAGDIDLELDPKTEDLLAVAEEEGESWSDDPVRMYLTQMGEIPLLTRQEEISLAKQIEMTRARFRRRLLECDYVMQTGGQGAAARARRRTAVRPHGAGLGDRPAGKGPDSGPVSAQSADPRHPAQAEPRRLPHRHQQVAHDGRSAATPGIGWAAAAAAPCGWSRNSACARSGSSR